MPREDTQFKPGQSGNPNGRPPKAWSWSDVLQEVAERIDPQTKKEFRTAAAEALFKKVLDGDVGAMKVYMDRMDGLPRQGVDADVKGAFELVIKDYTDDDSTATKTEGSDQE